MITHAPTQSKRAATPTFLLGRGLLLQRKCACGSSISSLTGECAECKSRKRLQTRLAIGASNDPLEQEADRVADQVLEGPSNPAVSGAPRHIQRFTGQAPGQADTAPASVDRALASPGSPLGPALRQDMESRFGHDFSRVRVHSGGAAEQSARDVNAQAYAVGTHIVFGAGRFAPDTHAGRHLIAHELAHVLQQQDHRPMVQRQPSARLLTAAAAAAAVADVRSHYDEDSIRTLEQYSSRSADGVFDADDAEALAKLQQALGLTASGKADEAFLDAILKIVGSTAAARSALIHLVVDRAKLDMSGTLAVIYDPGLTPASGIDTLPGGVSTIRVGDKSFASYRLMVAQIKKQLAVRPAASPVTTVPTTVLTDATKQQQGITINKAMVNDPRSIRLLQGALGSKATGKWDVELVRHIAAKKQALGRLTPNGMLDETTLAAIVADMIARGSQNAALQVIVDYYDLDRSHAFNIVFDPSAPNPTAEAQTLGIGGVGTPGVVHVYPLAFTLPFAGLVHVVAHELGHVQQVMKGIASLNLREFLSRGIEIESRGMPTESIESDTDIDLMIRGRPPAHPGFLQDVNAMLHWWGLMTPAERAAQHLRFRDLRSIVVTRINTEGSTSQQTKLAPLVGLLNGADARVP